MSQNWGTPALVGCGVPRCASPTTRHSSPKVWHSPPPVQHSHEYGPQQRRRSPTSNQSSHPRGHKEWSPGRWQLLQNQRRSWGWSPTTPQFAPRYQSSPGPTPFFREPRGGNTQVRCDIYLL
uniref:LOC100135215 protein n=1 Tax=Xenopus tropicalis TaxID=8364 RepID=A9ULK7_XENTR|nr:uncharacterized protein LOC100135215 [Xenopus tropicalis]AAI57295.1 LOC100135215 protein [Xenopus tropicalis]